MFTRAEIIERLWGKGAFLDTDNGVNTAIRKIRIALHDDAEQPRFISTLPGRGYRFIGELHKEAENPEISPPASTSPRPSTSSEITSHQQSVVFLLSWPNRERFDPWCFGGQSCFFALRQFWSDHSFGTRRNETAPSKDERCWLSFRS
jgi:hypothetical protein